MPGEPAAWLVEHRDLLPRSGVALDLACGRGRHALWLAARGFRVRAIDRDVEAVSALRRDAEALGLAIDAIAVDIERTGFSFGDERFDVIVVVNYLHRPLFPRLLAALKPGGVLVYETFTREQAARGRPTNPDYLLERGELRRLTSSLRMLAEREGEDAGRFVSSLVARKHMRGVEAGEHEESKTATVQRG